MSALLSRCSAGVPCQSRRGSPAPCVLPHRLHVHVPMAHSGCGTGEPGTRRESLLDRRENLLLLFSGIATQVSSSANPAESAEVSNLSKFEPMEALKDKDYGKPRNRYSDYVLTPTGLQYQDIREGQGEPIKDGQTAVVDWSGYTIGYYGRPFEARNKPKGSAFTGEDKDFLRFRLGDHTMMPGFEEAVRGMKVGGFRRVIVPPELSYPDGSWDKQGPKPTSFSGRRALGFVLANQGFVDKTLLIDVELLKILN
ncbi:hypothetical protein DUNSADRAFT_10061 [Dunaliella salina]|uniref:peptidylprolyl isomerase n=1 Tax=Dunaliella salina TaxID=3046 RepID=A0ABQ7GG43_DUNSA|nr:hypothetical protein DUNSADRAFT_10061 [Dunaliella salina]|eukprot:KAF5833570.1 hypothetical protein DUNSADRAFT_10061 [Dunaliella salina]